MPFNRSDKVARTAFRSMILRPSVLWLTATATLWLHALLGIPGDYLGQGYPLYPGLTVTLTGLAIEAALATLPIALVAALARWLRLRWLALPPLLLLWIGAASGLIEAFTIDFGTTWAPIEPLRELFLHPLHTPVALAAVLAVAAWTLAPSRRT